MTKPRQQRAAASAPEGRRVAIYTRKSTTMGLEQEFNSLDAQYESCLAYIQRQPGWMLVDERYDDGGFTGANTDRPAFQRLMADVDAGKVDVIVVYKVDRLSRSLLDFVKVMERLGVAGASFVSVTQNFSTADAMGRLTMNMLMSFAEFEREMIKDERWRRSSVDRFIGKMEQALKVLKAPDGDPAFAAEIAELKARLEERRAGLSDGAARERQKAALARVSATMARVLPGLDSERPNDPAELNVDDLTIRVTGTSGRPDFLWEIGSGANWLSYHIAAMLGLHELFLSLQGSPVPSILVLDQPSQVYFPRTLAKEAKEGDDPTLDDEDIAAVRKVFETLAAATKASKGLQILVLDHASEEVWDGIDVHVVDVWRDGKALVPQAWLVG